MLETVLRKQVIICEEIFHDGGPQAEIPLRKAAIVSIIQNPFVGHYEENIVPFVDKLMPLGLDMAERLIDVLGGMPQLFKAMVRARLSAVRASMSTVRFGMCREA